AAKRAVSKTGKSVKTKRAVRTSLPEHLIDAVPLRATRASVRHVRRVPFVLVFAATPAAQSASATIASSIVRLLCGSPSSVPAAGPARVAPARGAALSARDDADAVPVVLCGARAPLTGAEARARTRAAVAAVASAVRAADAAAAVAAVV